ncbi:MAG: SseB family protein [Saccharofermentans sp.]|nr:SseB family protein [Saccharofermentans sp.]
MAFFGKKKKVDAPGAEPAENKESNSVTEEMKIILAAREEEKLERQARAEERQLAQEEAGKQEILVEEQARQAAAKIIEGDTIPDGMNFFVIIDEIPLSAAPEKEGNIVVRGNVRGTVRKDTEVFLYQGRGDKFKVRIESIRNDNREFVDELSYERAEIEITRGDIPLPVDPDEDASRPVQRYAVLTDAVGIADMADPACRGMSEKGNPRTVAMLCEYGKYGKEPVYFGTVMDCLMTSEFVTLSKITSNKDGKSTVSFMGISPKNTPGVSFLPVFTDQRLAKKAVTNGFAKKGGPDKRLCMSFAQVAAISRDSHHQGFIVNPGGPVSITIPKDLIDKMVDTVLFKERFGEGAGDNPSLALGANAGRVSDNSAVNGSPDNAGKQRMLITDPSSTPEFGVVANAVRKYCGAHSDIVKVLILVLTPENNRKDVSYLCIMDCPDETFEAECRGLAGAMKPFLRGIRRIQFQQLSKMNKDNFPSNAKWLYSKLPQ